MSKVQHFQKTNSTGDTKAILGGYNSQQLSEFLEESYSSGYGNVDHTTVGFARKRYLQLTGTKYQRRAEA